MKSSEKIVERLWEDYRFGVVPHDASSIQVNECRRAFYGGVQSILAEMTRAMSPGDDITDEDMSFVSSVNAELSAFLHNVLKGRA